MIDFYISASFHTFYGPSWQLEATGESLTWVKSLNGTIIEEKRLELLPDTIDSFIKECDEHRVFTWESHYQHCCMLDGATWSVIIRYRDYTFRSGGTNGYPDNWLQFCEFLSKLANLGRNPCETMVSQVDNQNKPW